MARRVILLRHAAPQVNSSRDPHYWGLSAEGRSAAAGLRSRMPVTATFAASDELKAIETLRAATDCEFVVDGRFGKVCRPREPISDDFRAVRRDWVAGALDARHDGWESPDAAAARFANGLDALAGDVLVVATHGMVLSAWLVSVGEIRPGAAAADFWEHLALPDFFEVDWP